MDAHKSFLLTERCADSVQELASWSVATFNAPLDSLAQRRVSAVLLDLWGVSVAGSGTPEMDQLLSAWPCPEGGTPLLGTPHHSDPETVAFLETVAACMLELDEGNKHAAGHPAAHVVPAAVAAARLSAAPVPGPRLLAAVVAGYEVAARFGRATRTHPGWHPHGHWGATGAATAAALLMGAGPRQVAAAIDSATGLAQVAPWGRVLDGDFTRNLWIAGASVGGLRAARLALAELVQNTGATQHTLGGLVGDLDTDLLTAGLGDEPLMVTQGYLKQHAACSYTHAAIDILATLHEAQPWAIEEVQGVRVRTHSLARPLLARHPRNRLAGMFSLPFVVACALANGRVDPRTMTPGTPAFEAAEEVSERVVVTVDEQLDAYLPRLRVTEVEVDLTGGRSLALAQPNPIGDADHFPLDEQALRLKIETLVGADRAARIETAVAALSESPDAVRTLQSMGPLAR
ncbi:MAG: MmgE/PrpD family protein [Nocardioides marinisabuli]|uniref:MmgE/PrpD family protein n=1 Tax=Nocardioides marinisabuli TaxID=419476 RepID=UPI0032196D67